MLKTTDKLKGLSTALLATLFWGGAYPVSRLLFNHSAEEFNGLTLSFIRFLASALILSPALFDKKSLQTFKNNWKKDIFVIAGIASIGVVAESILLLFSTKYTTAARASMLANASPIFTIFLSVWITKERLNGKKISGLTIGALGVVILLFSQGEDIFTNGKPTITGDFIALLSGVCWALYTVLGKKPIEKYSAFFLTELLFIVATVEIIPFIVISGNGFTIPLTPVNIFGILYHGVISGAGAYFLWYAALKYLQPGELGVFGYLTPLIAAGSSIVFFSEKISYIFLLSLLFISGGVALTLSTSRTIKEKQKNI